MKNRQMYIAVLILMLLAALVSCGEKKKLQKSEENSVDTVNTEVEKGTEKSKNRKEGIPESVPVYLGEEQKLVCTVEAEEGSFTGDVVSEDELTGYSGTGYISGLKDEDDTFTVTIRVEEDGAYDLNFISASLGGYKENYVYVDDMNAGTISTSKEQFAASILEHVYLTAGEHKVTVKKYWGWVAIDRVEVFTSKAINPKIYQVQPVLTNKNATDGAKRLMSYLCDIYDEYFLSGQYCSTGQYGKEFVVIEKTTGKTPAVLGLDFIEYSPSRVANGSSGNQTELAINFWKKGGIVTFCWHWNAPKKYLTKEWYRGFYTDATNIDLEKIMNGRDPEGYELLMQDIEVIAKELLKLQEAGVPILWRPLHEASGGWFWWGASGAESYKKLYQLLYEKLTKEYGINNLIWVWNGQDSEWYPGDQYVDIIGEDVYPGEHVYTSQIARYLKAKNYTTVNKLVYLTENGCVFDPELAIRDGARWGIWCTWGSEFVAKNIGIHTLSEQYTEADMLIKAYSHEKVLTLEELPDLTKYPMNQQ